MSCRRWPESSSRPPPLPGPGLDRLVDARGLDGLEQVFVVLHLPVHGKGVVQEVKEVVRVQPHGEALALLGNGQCLQGVLVGLVRPVIEDSGDVDPQGGGALCCLGRLCELLLYRSGRSGFALSPLSRDRYWFLRLGCFRLFLQGGRRLGGGQKQPAPRFLLLDGGVGFFSACNGRNGFALNALGRRCDRPLCLGHFWLFLRGGRRLGGGRSSCFLLFLRCGDGLCLWGRLF